jgi:hypothetical protein
VIRSGALQSIRIRRLRPLRYRGSAFSSRISCSYRVSVR